MSRSGFAGRAGDDAIEFRSRLPGIAFPAVPDERGMTMLALQYQFERTERWSAARLRQYQFRQLEALLAHAAAQSPYWCEVLPASGFRAGAALTEEIWRRIPILARAGLQRDGAAMRAQFVPGFHGKVHESTSSGSTGRPVKALKTELSMLLFDAVVLREALWQRRNFAGTLAVLRSLNAVSPKEGKRAGDWNRAIGSALAGGPSVLFECMRPAPELARALARLDPEYVLLYPSLLAEIAREARRQGLRYPSLAGISTFGEHLGDDVRAAAAAQFGVPVADVYSAGELGYLALQCPSGTAYHVQSETVLVEVLNEAGADCAPGEIGRVVVTPLHNFAMPLIRYDIGDFAEAGAPCRCGRGLPVLTRILGRARNMLVSPDGARIWPRLNPLYNDPTLPLEQFQVIQRAADRLELRVVAKRAFGAEEEEKLRAILRRQCGRHFHVEITYHAAIPRGPTGKYEDFLCEIDPAREAPAR